MIRDGSPARNSMQAKTARITAAFPKLGCRISVSATAGGMASTSQNRFPLRRRRS